ncbi:MAG: hypothetical protein FIA94_04325 [Nitrospirae bacterium]|nr:hypothetical protein [Nitrospirota bacterium]
MKPFTLLISAICLFALSSLAVAIHETQPAETQVVLPGANAAKLYDYITKQKPYTSWEMWPGKGKMYKGTQPHGDFLTTYVNDAAMSGIKAKKGSMPDGSIIAKENYGADKKFAALTVMYKIKGYNPAAADWFWAKYDGGGKIVASGKAEACIRCHEMNKGNDYIYSGQLKK